MKTLTFIPFLFLLFYSATAFGQFPNDSTYQSWWAIKSSSIFKNIDNGQYFGKTDGYLKVVQEEKEDTLLLDFQATEAILDIKKDPGQVYDNSIKTFLTKTTTGNTVVTYSTYALANILSIQLNGKWHSIGTIDGASDMPILGLSFNYRNEDNMEYLSLFVSKPLKLTTTEHLMRTKKLNYLEAKELSQKLTLLPGSNLLIKIVKVNN